MHILSDFADDVPLRRVLANVVGGRPGGEDTVACLHGTPDLGGRFPDHLSEMRSLRIGRVILGRFSVPRRDRVSNCKRPRSGSEIFPEGAQRAHRVLELAIVDPLLGFGGEVVAPSERLGTVLRPFVVMPLQVL